MIKCLTTNFPEGDIRYDVLEEDRFCLYNKKKYSEPAINCVFEEIHFDDTNDEEDDDDVIVVKYHKNNEQELQSKESCTICKSNHNCLNNQEEYILKYNKCESKPLVFTYSKWKIKQNTSNKNMQDFCVNLNKKWKCISVRVENINCTKSVNINLNIVYFQRIKSNCDVSSDSKNKFIKVFKEFRPFDNQHQRTDQNEINNNKSIRNEDKQIDIVAKNKQYNRIIKRKKYKLNYHTKLIIYNNNQISSIYFSRCINFRLIKIRKCIFSYPSLINKIVISKLIKYYRSNNSNKCSLYIFYINIKRKKLNKNISNNFSQIVTFSKNNIIDSKCIQCKNSNIINNNNNTKFGISNNEKIDKHIIKSRTKSYKSDTNTSNNYCNIISFLSFINLIVKLSLSKLFKFGNEENIYCDWLLISLIVSIIICISSSLLSLICSNILSSKCGMTCLNVLSFSFKKLIDDESSSMKCQNVPKNSFPEQNPPPPTEIFRSKTTSSVRTKNGNIAVCWFTIFLMFFITSNADPVVAIFDDQIIQHQTRFQRSTNSVFNRTGDVCQSIDIRNSLENLNQIKGCRVIEGFLQIFIEWGTAEEWENYSFPELQEITDYFLIYRNVGLRSLGHLFPNLTVIRGQNLLHNYAFVVYECTGIKEIGLSHLTDVMRGSFLIMKNPALCYVETVDWDLISRTKGGHMIKDNRHPNECPTCPVTISDKHLCIPKNTSISTRPLCVNKYDCQKICKPECQGACDDNGDCCHEFCLGGCNGPYSNNCSSCQNFEYDKQCVQNCPGHTYKFLSRRCITADECESQPPPLSSEIVKHWKYVKDEIANENVCVTDCPKGYVEKETTKGKIECRRCEGDCKKVCQGSNIESIQRLQIYKECTYIKGSLEIQLQNGIANVIQELEDNLGMIEVIEGYLKIARSYPLMSLNFFKNLKVIEGKYLETNKFALVVLDNQNLMELWDWKRRNQSLTIRNGRIFFHFNPKLCYYHIETLMKKAGVKEVTDAEVPKSSNGDKAACNITEINATVSHIGSYLVIVTWEKFNHYDTRSLLSYLIFYKETEFQNVTLYDGRDACGDDGWRMEDFENIDDKPAITNSPESLNTSKNLVHIIPKLKPFTQYAYYVKTYTIATERNGAQSPIQYFRTHPATPSVPRELTAKPLSSSELEISWQPPAEPRGNITHYYIVGSWEVDDAALNGERNYCRYPTLFPQTNAVVTTTPSTLISTSTSSSKENSKAINLPGGGFYIDYDEITTTDEDGNKKCVCKKNGKSEDVRQKESVREIEIAFENALQNQVYVKRTVMEGPSRDSSRERRDTLNLVSTRQRRTGPEEGYEVKVSDKFPEFHKTNSTKLYYLVPSPSGNVTVNGVYKSFEYVIYGATSFVLKNLSHYAKYNIEVYACREVVRGEKFGPENSNCSTKAMVNKRTLMKEGVDAINDTSFYIKAINGTKYAFWEEPKNPNGLVVAYKIEYQNEDKTKVLAHSCIPKTEFDKQGRFELQPHLGSGNYSIHICAISLAGEGPCTKNLYFVIQNPPLTKLEVFMIIFLLSFFIVLVILCAVYYRRERRPIINPSINPEYIPIYKKDNWEVPRSKIKIFDELGNGSFGMVHRGIIKDFNNIAEHLCAVKLVNDTASDRERAEFLNEASIMKAFNTNHVVKLYGVVSEGIPALVIMELMALGDLKNYLRSCRPDADNELNRTPPSTERILQMAAEIADGMAYLADKKYVHRDLAARNCMVNEHLTVKVGDFGMTRDIYETEYYRKGSRGFLPVRWMAPESLKDGVFTSASDVWSYGVVLWEMATLASQPYQGLANEQVLNWVKGGGLLVRPDNCADEFFDLMRRCWQFIPSERPTFMEILNFLEEHTMPNFREVSYYNSEAAQEARRRHLIEQATKAAQDERIPLHHPEDIEDFSLGSDDDDDEEENEADVFHRLVKDVQDPCNATSESSTIGGGSTLGGNSLRRTRNSINSTGSTPRNSIVSGIINNNSTTIGGGSLSHIGNAMNNLSHLGNSTGTASLSRHVNGHVTNRRNGNATPSTPV